MIDWSDYERRDANFEPIKGLKPGTQFVAEQFLLTVPQFVALEAGFGGDDSWSFAGWLADTGWSKKAIVSRLERA